MIMIILEIFVAFSKFKKKTKVVLGILAFKKREKKEEANNNNKIKMVPLKNRNNEIRRVKCN